MHSSLEEGGVHKISFIGSFVLLFCRSFFPSYVTAKSAAEFNVLHMETSLKTNGDEQAVCKQTKELGTFVRA